VTAEETATTAAPADPPASEPVTGRRPFGVGSLTTELVDTGRGTPAVAAQGIEARDERRLDLTVLYPTDEADPPGDGPAGTGAGIVDGSDPPADTGTEPAPGPFPLLVFAHGWNGSGASLVGPATRWASAGYVVALPTFPLSREGIAVDLDMVNQPGDVSFVIDTLLARSGDPDDLLAGAVDPDRIAAGGHSLGSATVFGFENSCCKDARVKAIVAVSGGPAPYSSGSYDPVFATPMLLVHGAKDPGVNAAISQAVFAQTPGRMALLVLDEADHTSHFGGEDGAILDRVTIAWLDRELGLDPGAWERLEEEVAATGRGSLRSKGS
jgi:dienelactone hydrolase